MEFKNLWRDLRHYWRYRRLALTFRRTRTDTMRTKAAMQRAVDNAVELRIRMDLKQLKKDLLTPYPQPKFAGQVFIRALGAINLLEKDLERLNGP